MAAVTTAAELTIGECWEALNGVSMGRVLYTIDALPVVQPVRIAVQDHHILFSVNVCTAAKILRGGESFAALQADDLTPGARMGRTVIVYGTAQLVEPSALDLEVRLGLVSGGDAVYGCIEPSRMVGIRVKFGS